MRQRRETVEHPFGTIKARMGATHFLMKTLPRVASEMALHVLAYNLTRVMNIMGVQPLMAAMRAEFAATLRPSALLELPRSAGIPSEALPDKKSTKLGKMTERAYLAKVRYPSTLLRSVLAQPRSFATEPSSPGADRCSLLLRKRPNAAPRRNDAMGHVWTAPAVQEESDISAKRSGAAMYSACFRMED